MTDTPRLLLTGASGFLGAVLRPRLSEQYAVTAISRQCRKDWIEADLTNTAATSRAVSEVRPAIVIHAAAWTSVDGCERDQAQAYLQNVVATSNLVKACAALSPIPRFVFISTDQVYDGAGPHGENGPVVPRNAYALTKLWAEDIALRLASTIVLRSNFFGFGRRRDEGLASWLISSLSEGRTVTLFEDVLFNPLYIEDYVDLLLGLIGSKARGVVNVGADGEGLSKAAFAYVLAERFRIPTAGAVSASVESVKLPAARPKDMRMNIGRLRELLPGQAIPTVTEGIDRMRRDADEAHANARQWNLS
jgi:dTDP-4-dehydrorhamnose reductase